MEHKEYELMAEQQDSHWWFRARRRIIASTIQRIAKGKKLRILEVGCGMGGNLSMLSEFGEVYAVEMNEYAIEYSRSKNIAKEIKPGVLPDDFPYKQEKFDLIVMLDVLEHIDGDLASLNALKNSLTEGGRLLITVPAFSHLWSDHDVLMHHKRRYTKVSLKKVIDEAGLKVRFISYYNFFLYPVIAAVRMLGNFKKKLSHTSSIPAKSDLEHGSPVAFKLAEGIFASERHILRPFGLPFGVSLIAEISLN